MPDKWEIVFLIYADFREGSGILLDNKLVRELNSLFGSIANAKLDNTTDIFVIINRIRYKAVGGLGITNDTTLIYKAEQRPGRKNKLSKFIPSSASILTGFQPLQHALSLENIFRSITNASRANRTLLITWDHGSAFGIFRRDTDPDQIRLDQFKPLENFQEQLNGWDDFAEEVMQDNEKIKQQPVSEFFRQEVFQKPIYSYDNVNFFLSGTDSPGNALNDIFLQTFTKNNHLFSTTFKNQLIININGSDKKLEFTSSAQHNGLELFDLLINKKNNTTIPGNAAVDHALHLSATIETADTLLEILTNEELADAIKKGFGRKADVLLMMNCYMMNMHACYAFKENVQYFVAPQTGIDEPGYDYQTIIESITKHSNTTTLEAREIAKTCLSSTFNTGRLHFIEAIKQWAIFCINLDNDHVTRLADELDTLGGYLNEHLDDLKAIIREIREVCFRFDDAKNLTYNMIDITHFLKLLNEAILQFEENDPIRKHSLVLSTHLKGIQDIKQAISIEEQEIAGEIYDVSWAAGTNTSFNATGLSIYFPLSLDTTSPIFDYFLAPNAPFPSNLLKEKKNWLLFLQKIIP